MAADEEAARGVEVALLRERIRLVRAELEDAAEDLERLMPYVKHRGHAQLRLQQEQLRRIASHLMLEEGADEPDEPLSRDLMKHAKRTLAVVLIVVGSLASGFSAGVGEGIGQEVVAEVHRRHEVVATIGGASADARDQLLYQGVISDIQSLLNGQRDAATDEEDMLWAEAERLAQEFGRPRPSDVPASDRLHWLEQERMWLIGTSRAESGAEP